MHIARFTLGMAVAIMVALITIPTSAAQGHRGGKDRRKMIEHAIERLDLTQEQQARIKAIREQFKSDNAALIAELKEAHEQMRDARKDRDRERAEQIREAMAPKAEQLRAARERMKEQILAVLTPEQRAELEKMKAEHKERKGRKGEGRRKGGEARGNGKMQNEKHGEAELD